MEATVYGAPNGTIYIYSASRGSGETQDAPNKMPAIVDSREGQDRSLAFVMARHIHFFLEAKVAARDVAQKLG